MATYFVMYDLMAPGKNYKPLTDRIEQCGGVRVLLSTWAVKSPMTARDVWNDFARFIDRNDRLIVVHVDERQGGWYRSAAILNDPLLARAA